MSDSQQIGNLESALLERAKKLAAEYLAGGQQVHKQIIADANQRLRVEEEREVLAAKAHAERIYQQRIQAAELELSSELDHVRWDLVNTILEYLPGRLKELAADDAHYHPLLLDWLREAAQAIERDHLLVQANPRDLQHLKKDWARYAKAAAADKRLELSEQTIDCIGGILVSSEDGDIRFDNTFEGRMEKLGDALHGVIIEQLASGEVHRG